MRSGQGEAEPFDLQHPSRGRAATLPPSARETGLLRNVDTQRLRAPTVPPPTRSTPVRTLFLSDLHLGSRHCRADELLHFLDEYEPRRLYLVGDIVDGWRLRKSWYWTPTYSRVVDRLVALAERGTEVFYTPGNHDDFLRNERHLSPFLSAFRMVRVADEFVHEGADGRRFLVTHGDRFDRVECGAQWMSGLAAMGYEFVLRANGVFRRRRGHRPPVSALLKRSVKRLVRYISDFEDRLLEHARSRGCDGVVCGHIHTPTIATRGRLTYCNSGDWVEHCSALLEHADGRLELVYAHPQTTAPPEDSLPEPWDAPSPVLAGELASVAAPASEPLPVRAVR